MNPSRLQGVLPLLATSIFLTGCAASSSAPPAASPASRPIDQPSLQQPAASQLPAIGLEPDAPLPAEYLDDERDPLSAFPPGPPVTIATRDADVGSLLVALAEQAGMSLVIDPAIQGRRVTVNFVDIPAREAIRALLAAAELGIAPGPPVPPSEPTVFYALPVNVDMASAELIRQRFGVSAELARWLVEQRLP